MRRLEFWFLARFAFVALFLGCTHGPATDATEVLVSRAFSDTLHVDSALPTAIRDELRAASDEWLEVSEGNVRIRLVYDLDLDSVEGLREHAAHAMVIGLLSDMPIVSTIDKRLGGPHVWPLGVTVRSATAPTIVFFILDRIPLKKFRAVAMHEFGHVIGLPDLTERGHVMSGVDVAGMHVLLKFTSADRELCARYRYCPRP